MTTTLDSLPLRLVVRTDGTYLEGPLGRSVIVARPSSFGSTTADHIGLVRPSSGWISPAQPGAK